MLDVTGDYTDQRLAATYGAVTGAVISGGIAAVEAVAGRVCRPCCPSLTSRAEPEPSKPSRQPS